ncbi:YkgJ family cysteine cluster protein [Pseudomonas sp. W5-36]|uniref:YkgJ family cysteine cluster protein n=1 Tax=Pseudomonas sp. W5-36 TaxID=3097455 RepID=UPI0039791534
MQHQPTRFNCVGCGACCKGRFIPLTLLEARQWLERGHDVAILLEAFKQPHWPASEQEYQHSLLRSAQVSCGNTHVQVTAIFAANALAQCPNLQANDLCGIYKERPLVCRIYPMEINPFIELMPQNKDCPSDAWEHGEIIASDTGPESSLSSLIQVSRLSDRADARAKVAICNRLGINVAAWKADALVIQFPAREQLLQAINAEGATPEAGPQALGKWKLRVAQSPLSEALAHGELALDEAESVNYAFHALR